MRDIGVISVGRSDYSILRPILNKINSSALLNLNIIVSGMHMAPEFGLTVSEIENDGWNIKAKVEHLISSDTPTGLAKSIGVGIMSFADLFSQYQPDVLLIMGDRFEMLSAALAAQPFGIPIAHIHGGEITQGAIDEAFRHSITKMSHIHFAATELSKKRIIQLGENKDYVHNFGAPALDNLLDYRKPTFKQLEDLIGKKLSYPPFLVTYHPETIDPIHNIENLKNIFTFLKSKETPAIFTASNADTQGRSLNNLIIEECEKNEHFHFQQNLGQEGYFTLMSHAKAMIGNSSSGIIEAASFKLPVLNLGFRQYGREHGQNVIHCTCTVEEIEKAFEKINSPKFISKLRNIQNPYFNGGSAEKICEILESPKINKEITKKSFFTL